MQTILILNFTSSNPRSGNSLFKINRSTIFAGLSFENSIITQITPLSWTNLVFLNILDYLIALLLTAPYITAHYSKMQQMNKYLHLSA